MADRSDITGVRISGSAEWVSRLADDIGRLDACTVLERAEMPLDRSRLRVRMTVLHGYPPVRQVTAWLAANGWEKHPDGVAGAIWSKDGKRVGVPLGDGDEWHTRAALERAAQAEGMTISELVAAIHVGLPGPRPDADRCYAIADEDMVVAEPNSGGGLDTWNF